MTGAEATVETAMSGAEMENTTAQYSLLPDQQKALKQALGPLFRRPLFIVGSGVSVGQGVPRMSDVFRYLHDRLGPMVVEMSQSAGTVLPRISATDVATVAEAAGLAETLYTGTTFRSLAAKLLGELQDSRVIQIQELWKEFCLQFLAGRLDTVPAGSPRLLTDLEPSAAHRVIARLYEQLNAVALSFNFDGLTHRALREHFANAGDRVFILDETDKIREFYGRQPRGPRNWPVWKIRGDVFFAVCRTSGCPSRGKPTPVYNLTRGLGSAPPPGGPAALLACVECGEQRSLRISFPGLAQKEEETASIADEAWRFLVPTLSSVFVLGFSGVWDESIVHSIFEMADHQRIPIFDIKPKDDRPDNEYIAHTHQVSFPRVQFVRINATADAFMLSLESWLQRQVTSEECRDLPSSVPLRSDELWDEKSHFALTIPGRQQPIVVPQSNSALAYHVANHHEVLKLQQYSQLGLKDYWWGRKSFALHNRYLHSLGTARVASAWHQALGDSLHANLHPRPTREGLKRENHFLMLAALLHDFGHLPFSHLFEEVFGELHWQLDPSDPAYSHVAVGTKKIAAFLQTHFSEFCGEPHEDGSGDLVRTKYAAADVISVITGSSGVGYLDAIVNSPIDADKIDYIFRDAVELRLGVRLPPKPTWFGEFLGDQSVSQEGLICLNGRSALRLLELLETRRALFSDFYLAPWIRTMEALAALVIIKFLVIFTSNEIFSRLQSRTLPDPSPDWAALKIGAVTERLDAVYSAITQEREEELSYNPTLEQPLLLALLADLKSTFGVSISDDYRGEFLGRIESLFREFDAPARSPAQQPGEHGELLRRLYQRLHLAGPFRVHRQYEAKLREVVRRIQLTFPDKVVVVVSKMPRFLSTADARRYSARNCFGENILVPGADPSKWTMKSSACIPLHLCDFSQFETEHLEVVLIDPWEGTSITGRYVLDVFLRWCREAGVTGNWHDA